jgi:hypothetical protein
MFTNVNSHFHQINVPMTMQAPRRPANKPAWILMFSRVRCSIASSHGIIPRAARSLASEDHDEAQRARMYVQHRRPQHPSGRPIREPIVKRLGFTRRPFDEPLSPGLQRHRNISAIGFTANLTEERDDWRDSLTDDHQHAIGWKRD